MNIKYYRGSVGLNDWKPYVSVLDFAIFVILKKIVIYGHFSLLFKKLDAQFCT